MSANEKYLAVKNKPNSTRIEIKIFIKQAGLCLMILYFNNCTKRYVADQAIANGITAATDIPLTVPLSATEKGTLSHQKPSMMVEAAGPLSWGVARLFFGMPKNVGRAALAEQARLKEQAAKEQESKAKSIKDKNRIKQLKMTT